MADKKRKRRSEKSGANTSGEGAGFGNVLRSSLKGLAVATIAAVILLFVVSAIAYAGSDPDSVTMPLALAALYISSATAGFAAVKFNGSSALLCGVLSGLLLMILFIGISLFLNDSLSSEFSFPAALGLRAAMIIMSVLGGFIALHRPSKRKHRH